MQLPTIDRTPNLRPAGADLASSGANRVIPVAPVNPAVQESAALVPVPSVINMIKTELKPSQAEPVYASVSDPAIRGSEAATAPKDWTIHRPPVEKVEDPPPKPMSQLLLEHLKTIWTASASAVQIDQVHNQLVEPMLPPSIFDLPGEAARQALVYTPSKISKNEKI